MFVPLPGREREQNSIESRKAMVAFNRVTAASPMEKTGVVSTSIVGTHLAPSVCRVPTVTLALRQLLDAIIHCNAALARSQVFLRDLYPA